MSSRRTEPIDALVLAGGRIEGKYAEAAGTTVKALAHVEGTAVLRRVVDALHATPGMRRVCVVGPDEVQEVLPEGCHWRVETGTALGNLRAGLEHLETDGERLLLCASDLPALAAESLHDFCSRAPGDAEIAMPVVTREAFLAHFPAHPNSYVRLAEGRFTAGSQFLVRPGALLENLPLLEALFARRKSQLGMARALGFSVVLKLLTGRLSVPELEARASLLTGCRCRAVPECHPSLAFDIDRLVDFHYLRRAPVGKTPAAIR